MKCQCGKPVDILMGAEREPVCFDCFTGPRKSFNEIRERIDANLERRARVDAHKQAIAKSLLCSRCGDHGCDYCRGV